MHFTVVLILLDNMAETNKKKAALRTFGCSNHLTVDLLADILGINPNESIMTMENSIIKEIKKRLMDLIYPNDTAPDRLECDFQTLQAIDFLSREVQDLANQGLPVDLMLIQSINTNCYKLYKYVQCHLTHTNTKSNYSQLIDLLTLKSNTIPNSTQFSNWSRGVEST